MGCNRYRVAKNDTQTIGVVAGYLWDFETYGNAVDRQRLA